MRMFVRVLPAVVAGLFLLQCSESPPPAPTSEPQRTPANLTANELSLIESSNDFGLRLFREVSTTENPDNNVFISPLSVSYALGMAYNGAAGDTRDSIAATLELAGLSVEEINQSYKSMTDLFVQLDPDVTFDIANSIWYRLNLPIKSTFVDLNQIYFDALVRELDFNMEGAADTINGWIETNTNGRIDHVIDSPIDPSVLVYLINAIYFKAAWTETFESDDTYDASFHLLDGTETPCRMMSREDTTLRFFDNDVCRGLNLPYGTGDYSMTLLLPKSTVTMEQLIDELTPENWANWAGSFNTGWITIGIPKFKFEYETGLNSALKAMGMNIAFSGSADFSNMMETAGYIDTVIHKTFVQVGEEGTEAAAVTVITVCGMPPPMIFDRPFLFIIHENVSDVILFMGKVANPIWDESAG
ncbi:MAG: serpin family protein [candidate division Zixibacteria bacterium]|nr:serpin family protein [candidate division Zixibacteria bacterium]